MLETLHEELSGRNVRLMRARMIMPVRQMLELAGVMEKIRPQDIFYEPTEAIIDYLSSQYDDASIQELLQELLQSGANTVRNLMLASITSAPEERKAALNAMVDGLDQEIKKNDMNDPEVNLPEDETRL
jgi:hypothetical protein